MKYIILLVIVFICLSLSSCTTEPSSFPLEKALANGKPILAEFGGTNCIPCKEMWPILKELSKEYEERLNVVIVDVVKYPDIASKYGIRMIPIQLYFDSTGQVIARHLGAVTKEEIYVQLRTMGVN